MIDTKRITTYKELALTVLSTIVKGVEVSSLIDWVVDTYSDTSIRFTGNQNSFRDSKSRLFVQKVLLQSSVQTGTGRIACKNIAETNVS
ncbi:hypothetical protein Hamer_G026752 [Homarus americanus]|uniref:Uncharacterized protein n=1 Tax=Homarus americanus TaxID=6706 RepID=A0A8J5J6Q2_HOMAM|nr:hypothetical protein Hamer_G026752 [Homarus americanus]